MATRHYEGKKFNNNTIDKVVDAIFQIQGGYALVMLPQNS